MLYSPSVKSLFFIFLLGFASALGWASQAQNFGLDAESTGRVGSVTAEVDNAYSALFNPALLAAKSQKSFAFSTSQTQVQFNELGSIVLPRSQRRSDEPEKGNVQIPAINQTRWSLGFNYPVFLKSVSRKAGFGFALSGPYEKLRGFEAHAPDDFFSMRYGTADAQFKGTVSAALEIIPQKLFLGGGASLFLSGMGTAETRISDSPSSRLNMNVVLETAPVIGLYSQLGNSATALTYHQKIDPKFEQDLTARIQFSGRDTFYQPLLMKSSLYFEPESVEWDWQQRFEVMSLTVGVSYQFWNAYQAPVLFTETEDFLGGKLRTQGGGTQTRNTVNPRASVSLPISRTLKTAVGYQYRPTPLTDVSGASNALDSDTHIWGLSVQKTFPTSWVSETPLTFGVFGQLHKITAREVQKTVPEVSGGPGFNYSGNAYLVGVSAQADF
ncbi:MAG: hypothetical protein EB078_06915 [Proteobacteria bacterium]|nr:hypothetical protein [Pseudomonadota bacterium]NDC24889.1 hypothetical protein [Pseudomonadota bacterium]NDD04619.1 hypothetical protein [Pseudomonadota bacterium]NDG27162.1 hypothetical protein [Pseudomonadota bacterium]